MDKALLAGMGVFIFLWLHAIPMGAEKGGSLVTSDARIIAQGARLFQRNCSPCHGVKAVGEYPERPTGGLKTGLGQIAPALNGTGHAWHHPPQYFFQMIRNGTALQNSRMKGWAGRLKDEEILAVVAYFQSLWPKRIMDGYRHRYLEQVWK